MHELADRENVRKSRNIRTADTVPKKDEDESFVDFSLCTVEQYLNKLLLSAKSQNRQLEALLR